MKCIFPNCGAHRRKSQFTCNDHRVAVYVTPVGKYGGAYLDISAAALAMLATKRDTTSAPIALWFAVGPHAINVDSIPAKLMPTVFRYATGDQLDAIAEWAWTNNLA